MVELKSEVENEVGILKSINLTVIPASIKPESYATIQPITQSSLSVGDVVITIDSNYYRPTE